MAENTVFLLFLLASASNAETSEDVKVSCVYQESCVLPCSFEPGPDPIINWIKTEGDIPVYSIYIDQLQYQDDRYKHRTSLLEEVYTGNASLLLKEVKVQDEGRYVCLTSTRHGTVSNYLHLNVYVNKFEAAVLNEDSGLVFTFEGVYPKPEVICLPGPYKTTDRTEIVQREDHLYDVHNLVSKRSGDNIYVCVVMTAYSWKMASFKYAGKSLRAYDAVLPCFAPKSPVKVLIWKFNDQSIIYKRTGSESAINESWRPFVAGITFSNGLVLHNLTTDQEGLYSCHIITDTDTAVVVTKLEIFWVPLIYMCYIWLILAICCSGNRR